MTDIAAHFRLQFDPLADPAAVVVEAAAQRVAELAAGAALMGAYLRLDSGALRGPPGKPLPQQALFLLPGGHLAVLFGVPQEG